MHRDVDVGYLKPCPLCGCEQIRAHEEVEENGVIGTFFISCANHECHLFVTGGPLMDWRKYEEGPERKEAFRRHAVAKWNRRANKELISIHRILQCIADCPPVAKTDSWTVKGVKILAHRINKLRGPA